MATLSELYKKGRIEEGQLGVLAKTVICAKLGCNASGQEVVMFGDHALRLADSLPPRDSKSQNTQKPQARPAEVLGGGGRQPRQPVTDAKARRERGAASATESKRVVEQRSKQGPQPAQRPAAVEQRGEVQRRPTAEVGNREALAGKVARTEATTERRVAQKEQQPSQRPAAVAKTQPLFPPKEVQQRQEASSPPPGVQRHAPSGAQTPDGTLKQEPLPRIDYSRLEELAKSVAKDAKTDAAVARAVLTSIVHYLSVYPSVGILRLIDDIARKTKADRRVIGIAIDALRSIGAIEVVDGAVVNLKR